ncbi:hypothetical protein [Prochlorothrix hollandica]
MISARSIPGRSQDDPRTIDPRLAHDAAIAITSEFYPPELHPPESLD